MFFSMKTRKITLLILLYYVDNIKRFRVGVQCPKTTYIFYFYMNGLKSIFILFQDPEILQPQSNDILTAIVHAMKKEEPRYLEFVKNFCLCVGCQSNKTKVFLVFGNLLQHIVL